MKVFVVHEGECNMGDHRIVGVFSSQELADKAAGETGFVEEFELDGAVR